MAEPPGKRVSNEEILDVARCIIHDEYLAIGVRLGFTLVELRNWHECQFHHNTAVAAVDMLMRWRNKQVSDESATKEKLLAIISSSAPEGTITSSKDFMSKQISQKLTVQECQKMLIRNYKDTARIQLQPGQKRKTTDFKDLHTNIIVQKKIWTARGKETIEVELEGSINEIFETEVDGKLPPRIVLLGAAGYGKTTAMAKLAHDWAAEEDSPLRRRFPLLFWLNFRGTRKDSSLGEMIVKKLLQQLKGVSGEEIEEFLDLHGENCGIILDGLDEFSGDISTDSTTRTSLVELINFTRFPKCRVLVSSRPHLASHFDKEELPTVYAVMEIKGFTDVDAELYISKFFAHDNCKGRRLSEYLKTNLTLCSLMRIPFFCMSICLLWDCVKQNDLNTIDTLSKLFEILMQYLAAHAKERQNTTKKFKDKEELRSHTERIGKVAFEVFLNDNDRLILKKTEFDRRGCSEEFEVSAHLGLINTFDQETDDILQPTETCCEFYHKLAQEYCAGVYLSSLSPKELQKMLSSINQERIPGFENVLRFAAESGSSQSAGLVLKCILRTRPHYYNYTILHTLLLDILSFITYLDEQCMFLMNMMMSMAYPYGRVLSFRICSERTLLGVEKLQDYFKRDYPRFNLCTQFETISIIHSNLGPDLSKKLWTCLESFKSLKVLCIKLSSLHHPPGAPSLPHVQRIEAFELQTESYSVVMRALPGAKEMFFGVNDGNSDLNHIAHGLRGRKPGTRMTQNGKFNMYILPSAQPQAVRGTTVANLCDAIIKNLKGLLEFSFNGYLDDERVIEVVENLSALEHIKNISITQRKHKTPWPESNAPSYLEDIHQPKSPIRVRFKVAMELSWGQPHKYFQDKEYTIHRAPCQS